jgi:proteic killer suppression protein
MIRNFRHKGLERFFRTGSKAGIQPRHAERLRLMLTALENAVKPEDMKAPGWQFHQLTKNLAGFYAVSVSGNWRLIFRFEKTDAVDVNYMDYH